MSTKGALTNWDPFFWPCLLGGFCSPFAGALLTRWLPAGVANGLGFFLAWVVVGIAFCFSPPSPTWSLLRWTAGAAIGGLVGGFVTYWLQ